MTPCRCSAPFPGGHTAFELAVRQAEGLLNVLNREDSAGLVFLSGRPGMELTREKQKVVSALRGAKVTGSAGNLTSAVRQAVELLKGTQGINREIYLLTDLQIDIRIAEDPSFRLEERTSVRDPDFGIERECVDLGRPTRSIAENAGFECLSAVYDPQFESAQPDVPGDAEHYGKSGAVENHFRQGGFLVNEHFIYVPVRPGRVDGTITIDDPDIPLDNTLPSRFPFRI